MYQAFLTAQAYETALRDKQGKNGSPEPVKINEMEADFDELDMNVEIDAIRRKYQKKMFSSNNGSVYQQRHGGNNPYTSGNGNSNNRNGGNQQGGNQQSGSRGQRKPNPTFGKTCHYCKKKNHFQTKSKS